MDKGTVFVVFCLILGVFGSLTSCSYQHTECVKMLKDRPAEEIRRVCGPGS